MGNSPLGTFSFTPSSSVQTSPISVLDQWQVSVRKETVNANSGRKKEEKIVFCVESEGLRDRWAEELSKGVSFLMYLEGEKERRKGEKGVDVGVDLEDIVVDDEGEGIEMKETEPQDDQLKSEYDDMVRRLRDEASEAVRQTTRGGGGVLLRS